MKKEQDRQIARAIVQSCQTPAVKRATAALPQFKLAAELPENMLDLLTRLDNAAKKA